MNQDGAAEASLSDAAVAAKWREIAHIADVLERRGGTAGEFDPQPRSTASHDDSLLGGYPLSSAVIQGIVASVDHLHALTTLVVRQRILHLAAPASLARGVIENAAVAYWIAHPPSQPDRLLRTLRYWAQNAKDSDAVRVAFPNAGGPPSREISSRLTSLAADNSLSTRAVKQGYTSTAAVRYADEQSGEDVLFPWQLCSAFAHGRPWAYLGGLSQQQHSSPRPGIHNIRLTNDLRPVLYVALQGTRLLEALLKAWRERCEPST